MPKKNGSGPVRNAGDPEEAQEGGRTELRAFAVSSEAAPASPVGPEAFVLCEQALPFGLGCQEAQS